MHELQVNARNVRKRLFNPPNGSHSSELDIVTEPVLRARRIQQIKEAEEARREVERQAKLAAMIERSLEEEEKNRQKKREKITLSTEEKNLESGLPTINAVIVAVSDYYDVNVVDVLSHRREGRIVRVRHIAAYLCKTLTTRSLPEIGRRMGGRDHSTILHSVNKIKVAREMEPGLAAELEAIKKRLGQ